MSATIKKWGNSLGIRIPKTVAEKIEVVHGSKIDLIIKDGGLFVKPVEDAPTLEELLAKCVGENPHQEYFSEPVGREEI